MQDDSGLVRVTRVLFAVPFSTVQRLDGLSNWLARTTKEPDKSSLVSGNIVLN